jgi:hypothetical protein
MQAFQPRVFRARSLLPARARLLLPQLDAEAVIDVAVRVDDPRGERVRPTADGSLRLRGEEERPGVDEDQAVARLHRRRVGEARYEGDRVVDLLEREERRERVLDLRIALFEPITLELISDAPHSRQRIPVRGLAW